MSPTEDRGAHEAAVVRAYRVGAAIGLVLFLVVLTGARTTLLAWSPAGDFYDAQAESFLDGRLDIDPERLGIEGFASDGRTYMYQPPFPAVLRMPVAAVTDDYDGRLGQVSLLLAVLVALSAGRRLLVSARRALRPDSPATRIERAYALGLGLVLAGGSVPLFLASRSWVYHESAMWGMAWTLMAFAALLRHRTEPSWGTIALLGVSTFGAVGSRASVGAGACAAIGLVAVVELFTHRSRPWRARLVGPGGAVALLLVAALPAVAYATLNHAKFGTAASIPFEAQTFTRLSPARQAMLDENGGTLFGPQFVPTTLVHYLRPVGGLELTGRFPFVDFPDPGEPVIGDVTFDLVDRTASVPASLPALVVPAGVGVWILARRRVDDPWSWLAVAGGGIVSMATIIPFGYVAHRYLADVMPLLVVLAVLGVEGVIRRLDGTVHGGQRLRRSVAWTALVVLVPFSMLVNGGLATVYQRLYAPAPDPDLVAGLLDARATVGTGSEVRRADALPPTGDPDDVVVIGDCDAVYVWDGTPVGEFRTDAWIAAERTEAAGHVVFDLDLTALRPDVRYPLVVAPQAGPVVAWVERAADGAVRAGIDGGDEEARGLWTRPTGRTAVDVVLDPLSGEATIRLGDEVLVTSTISRGADVRGLEVGSAAGIDGYESTTPITTDDAAPGTRGDDGSLCATLTGE